MNLPEFHIERNPNSPSPDGIKSRADRPGRSRSAFLTRVPYPGLDAVLSKMRQLVDQGKGDPDVRAKAVEITRGIPKDIRTGLPNRRDYGKIADAVYSWMKKNIAYVNDPSGIEWLQTAKRTMDQKFGDCDDQSVLAGALLSSIGVPVRFKVVKANPDNRSAYSHVYLQYHDKSSWKGFDPTLHTQAGDELADYQTYGSRTVDLSGAEVLNISKNKLLTGLVVVGITYLAYREYKFQQNNSW
ncbi:MAG: transglutaminase-like domain-containing protein [Balneolaceae bacterium]